MIFAPIVDHTVNQMIEFCPLIFCLKIDGIEKLWIIMIIGFCAQSRLIRA